MTLAGHRAVGWLPVIAGIFTLCYAAGCQLTPSPGLVACPLPVAEQAAKVVEVAPLGSTREEAMKRLTDAGIRGNFGENESLFYCDVWERDQTERWHMNVVLLFDEQGRLYSTRPGIAGPEDPREAEGVQRVSTHVDGARDPFE